MAIKPCVGSFGHRSLNAETPGSRFSANGKEDRFSLQTFRPFFFTALEYGFSFTHVYKPEPYAKPPFQALGYIVSECRLDDFSQGEERNSAPLDPRPITVG